MKRDDPNNHRKPPIFLHRNKYQSVLLLRLTSIGFLQQRPCREYQGDTANKSAKN